MQKNRRVIARLAQQSDDALAFAQAVDSEKMCAVGIGGDRGRASRATSPMRRLMTENRKPEGRFSDEKIAATGSKAAQVGSAARL